MTSGTMTENARRYVERLNDLYGLIKEWLKESDPRAELVVSTASVNAGELGIYEAPQLTIRRPQAEDVSLVPRGHHTIAAQGRVDMKSRLGSETLVYLPEGGFSIKTTIHEGGRVVEEHERRLTPDVAEGGVWLEASEAHSLPSLDRDTFFRLMESLSQ